MGKPDVSVKDAHGVGHIIAIDGVATSDATVKALVPKSTMVSAGRNAINVVSLAFSGSTDSWLIPNVKAETDALASNANSGQKNVIVTTVTSFAVDDWVLLYENDYATHEFAKIASINTSTDTLTMYSNLTNSYTTADSAHALPIESWSNSNQYIVVPSGYDFGQEGLSWTSLYIRKMSATNITSKGYVGVI